MTNGKVILVGAGPGDPGLLTLRGKEALQEADVVIYDFLSNDELLRFAPATAEAIYVGKRAGEHSLEQSEINRLLLEKALAGNNVVRLKGGDCYVFGRGSEEALHLVSHGIAVEVIPGIPAAIGAAAYAGIPLTDRRHSSGVTFVTGSEDPDRPDSRLDWARIAKDNNTLVIYMGVRTLPGIVAALLEHGMAANTPVGIVEWACMPQQRTIQGTLETIVTLAQQHKIRPPSLTIIGSVNEFAPGLGWFEQRPLHGRNIVVTRSRQQAGNLSPLLQRLGARIIEMPVIAITPPEKQQELLAAVGKLEHFDWVMFTSVNGVDAVFKALECIGRDLRAFGKCKVAAIGAATGNHLQTHGIRPDFIPRIFTGATLFQELAEVADLKCKRILLPRADIASPELEELLRGAGAEVSNVEAYKTVPGDFDRERLRLWLAGGEIDVVTFTSSSTARFFADGIGPDFLSENKHKFAGIAIGPVTARTMADLAIPVAAVATQHDIPGLIQAILDYFNKDLP